MTDLRETEYLRQSREMWRRHHQELLEEVGKLTRERDELAKANAELGLGTVEAIGAAFERGALAMREAAAKVADCSEQLKHTRHVDGVGMGWQAGEQLARDIAAVIRALPVPPAAAEPSCPSSSNADTPAGVETAGRTAAESAGFVNPEDAGVKPSPRAPPDNTPSHKPGCTTMPGSPTYDPTCPRCSAWVREMHTPPWERCPTCKGPRDLPPHVRQMYPCSDAFHAQPAPKPTAVLGEDFVNVRSLRSPIGKADNPDWPPEPPKPDPDGCWDPRCGNPRPCPEHDERPKPDAAATDGKRLYVALVDYENLVSRLAEAEGLRDAAINNVDEARMDVTELKQKLAEAERDGMEMATNAERERQRAIAAEERAAKAEAFKKYVHERLERWGVPVDPEPEQTAKTGCRIEGRLSWWYRRMEDLEQAAKVEQDRAMNAKRREDEADRLRIAAEKRAADAEKRHQLEVDRACDLVDEKNALLSKLAAAEAALKVKDEALQLAGAHHQGAHSEVGRRIRAALSTPPADALRAVCLRVAEAAVEECASMVGFAVFSKREKWGPVLEEICADRAAGLRWWLKEGRQNFERFVDKALAPPAAKEGA